MTLPADLRGQIFGKLTAIEIDQEKSKQAGRVAWKCLCACGKEHSTLAKSLRNGSTASCGCSRKDSQQHNVIDITGQRFGRLLVLERVEAKTRTGNAAWECQCDCGTSTTVLGSSLRSGNTRSCGCLSAELAADRMRVDLSGKKHGKLTAIKSIGPNTSGNTLWLCECECGNTSKVTTNNWGRNQTCGCRTASPDTGLNKLFAKYKKGAQSRDLEFNLTRDEIKQLTSSACSYCGSPPTLISSSSKNESTRQGAGYYYNGIDRVDNSLGYLADNCVPCCETCNRMKHVLDAQLFLQHIQKISKFQNK